jgi:hypothetical protein
VPEQGVVAASTTAASPTTSRCAPSAVRVTAAARTLSRVIRSAVVNIRSPGAFVSGPRSVSVSAREGADRETVLVVGSRARYPSRFPLLKSPSGTGESKGVQLRFPTRSDCRSSRPARNRRSEPQLPTGFEYHALLDQGGDLTQTYCLVAPGELHKFAAPKRGAVLPQGSDNARAGRIESPRVFRWLLRLSAPTPS